jgi:hypothetical protein
MESRHCACSPDFLRGSNAPVEATEKTRNVHRPWQPQPSRRGVATARLWAVEGLQLPERTRARHRSVEPRARLLQHQRRRPPGYGRRRGRNWKDGGANGQVSRALPQRGIRPPADEACLRRLVRGGGFFKSDDHGKHRARCLFGSGTIYIAGVTVDPVDHSISIEAPSSSPLNYP